MGGEGVEGEGVEAGVAGGGGGGRWGEGRVEGNGNDGAGVCLTAVVLLVYNLALCTAPHCT